MHVLLFCLYYYACIHFYGSLLHILYYWHHCYRHLHFIVVIFRAAPSLSPVFVLHFHFCYDVLFGYAHSFRCSCVHLCVAFLPAASLYYLAFALLCVCLCYLVLVSAYFVILHICTYLAVLYCIAVLFVVAQYQHCDGCCSSSSSSSVLSFLLSLLLLAMSICYFQLHHLFALLSCLFARILWLFIALLCFSQYCGITIVMYVFISSDVIFTITMLSLLLFMSITILWYYQLLALLHCILARILLCYITLLQSLQYYSIIGLLQAFIGSDIDIVGTVLVTISATSIIALHCFVLLALLLQYCSMLLLLCYIIIDIGIIIVALHCTTRGFLAVLLTFHICMHSCILVLLVFLTPALLHCLCILYITLYYCTEHCHCWYT